MSEKQFKIHPIRLFDAALKLRLAGFDGKFGDLLKEIKEGCVNQLSVPDKLTDTEWEHENEFKKTHRD